VKQLDVLAVTYTYDTRAKRIANVLENPYERANLLHGNDKRKCKYFFKEKRNLFDREITHYTSKETTLYIVFEPNTYENGSTCVVMWWNLLSIVVSIKININDIGRFYNYDMCLIELEMTKAHR